jgi:hypothetical protein
MRNVEKERRGEHSRGGVGVGGGGGGWRGGGKGANVLEADSRTTMLADPENVLTPSKNGRLTSVEFCAVVKSRWTNAAVGILNPDSKTAQTSTRIMPKLNPDGCGLTQRISKTLTMRKVCFFCLQAAEEM